uniref:Uncharacterized protein n=1 Tax=Anguilla anguilla TaxID=7936 RepID=A0A0E9PBJ9_ANGAN
MRTGGCLLRFNVDFKFHGSESQEKSLAFVSSLMFQQ